jgi:hypothetical protein
MKKLSVIILTVILILLLVSCGNGGISENERLELLKAQYDVVGMEHNVQLDELLSMYSENEIHLNYECAKDLADQHFALTYTCGENDIAHDIVALIRNMPSFAKSTINADIIDILSDSLVIFAKYPEIFDSMTHVLDAVIPLEEKQAKLETLYLLADETIEDNDEKESILNGLSTTMYSLAYWDENYQQWQQELAGTLQKPCVGIAGALGIIDGTGAVIGTLEGIRDTYKGQEGRGRIIVGRAIGEAAKTSTYAVLAILLL